jgi:hypothetical protein
MTTQQISRPDKVLYPEPGYTKADLAGYYPATTRPSRSGCCHTCRAGHS